MSETMAPQWVKDAAWQSYLDRRGITDVTVSRVFATQKRAAVDAAAETAWIAAHGEIERARLAAREP